MANEFEITERQKNHLASLLRIKRAIGESEALINEIEMAIVGMKREDLAYVEKIIGVKAIDLD